MSPRAWRAPSVDPLEPGIYEVTMGRLAGQAVYVDDETGEDTWGYQIYLCYPIQSVFPVPVKALHLKRAGAAAREAFLKHADPIILQMMRV